MHKYALSSFFIMILLSAINSRAISIHNDLEYLAQADKKYTGFEHACVYVQGIMVPPFHTYTTPHDPQGYIIEIEVPAHFAAQLAGKELTSIGKSFFSLVRCYLHIHFKPRDSRGQEFSVAEILIEKAHNWDICKPDVTIRWHGLRGLRSITAYIKDN